MKNKELLIKYKQKNIYIKKMIKLDTLSFCHKIKKYWDKYLYNEFYYIINENKILEN